MMIIFYHRIHMSLCKQTFLPPNPPAFLKGLIPKLVKRRYANTYAKMLGNKDTQSHKDTITRLLYVNLS